MKTSIKVAACAALVAGAAGCATTLSDTEAAKLAVDMMKTSFKANGQATLDRLNQDDPQAVCSVSPETKIPKETLDRVEKAQLATVKFPADGKLLGDWRQGERIAQSGVGMQFSDNPTAPSGANCYACHQISPQEISFGTIGPSLTGYGKLRGNSKAIQEYTYTKIYNPQAYSACSNMPRFGHNRILTEEQIRHVTALLLDPESPVNK